MLGALAHEAAKGGLPGLLHRAQQEDVGPARGGLAGGCEVVRPVEVHRVDLGRVDEARDLDRLRVVDLHDRVEIGVLDDDELALRHLPALHDLVALDLALVGRAPALLLDRGHALAVQLPEGNVRLPGRRLRGQREPDRDVDQAEADGSVPDRAHGETELYLDRRFPPVVFSPQMRTIWSLWQKAVSEERTNPAYLVEGPDGWREISWADAARAVDELAHGLLSLGIGKGDAFGILARTRLEWSLFDFALAQLGTVPAPIYPSSTAKEACYILEHSKAVGCLVEDEEGLAKIEGARPKHVYTLDTLDELRALGREHAARDPDALERARAQVGEDDLFTFIYTSGT